MGLESIIKNIQREAKDNRGKDIQEDGSFDGPIKEDDWEDTVVKTEEENEGGILNTEDSIYQKPQLKSNEDSVEKSLDDMMEDADNFLESGTSNYNTTSLQTFSQTIYNILLTIGVVLTVLVGAFIGLKLMVVTSAEEKAETTKLIIPYLIGCMIIFGGFAIWKIAVNILSGI